MAQIGVVGTTSWGTTLAILLAQQGHQVSLLARTEEEARRLMDAGEHVGRVPGVPFPETLRVTADPQEALGQAQLVLLVVPSQTMAKNLAWVAEQVNPKAVVVSGTKGLEVGTGRRMSQLLREGLSEPLHRRICVLTGPNLSREIAAGRPASAVVASEDEEAAHLAQEWLMSPRFRVYTSTDVIGAELGGALKNIIALGAGICDGLEYGDNAKAGFMTRGLAEITRLGVAAGANPLTFAGLTGLGDLVATCSSPHSRNRYVGEQLAKGRKLPDILAGMNQVAEGVNTTTAALKLAEPLGVEMPIAEATARVLFHGLEVQQAITELMGRAPRPEWTGIGS